MNTHTKSYKALFCLSWVLLYLVFPAWRFPNNRSDLLIINIFMVYFTISAYVVSHYFDLLIIDKPVIVKINNWWEQIKDNAWLAVLCFLSMLLHLSSTPLIVMGEVIFLRQTFWIYDFLSMHFHELFNVPIQYVFWSIIVLTIFLIKQKKAMHYASDLICRHPSGKLKGPLVIFVMFCLLNIYAYLFPYYSWQESLEVVRYPPVSRLLYLTTYAALGVSDTGPRIVQFIFYILGAVYLYRTILLFNKKEAALLGATVYLFSPMLFFHATLASAGSGTTFFIILISYYFLKFIRQADNRALLLCTFFIGLGFLYKTDVLLMFIICFTYLVFSSILKRNAGAILHIKILLLSLISILPWLVIGPGNYQAAWSNVLSIDSLTTYARMLQGQFSWIIFSLFIVAVLFILFKRRDDLSLFFFLLFVIYYGSLTLKQEGIVHRYSLALYPAIHVFLAQFIFSITQRMPWQHSFRLVYAALTVFVVIICLVPRSSSPLVTYNYNDFENQQYPLDKAMDWVRVMTDREDKILAFYFYSDIRLYVERLYRHRDEIKDRITFLGFGSQDLVSSSEKLKQYCHAEKISYIMFPYSPRNSFPKFGEQEREKMTAHLKENMGNDFIEVAKFSLDDNYILIYKPKDKMPD